MLIYNLQLFFNHYELPGHYKLIYYNFLLVNQIRNFQQIKSIKLIYNELENITLLKDQEEIFQKEGYK